MDAKGGDRGALELHIELVPRLAAGDARGERRVVGDAGLAEVALELSRGVERNGEALLDVGSRDGILVNLELAEARDNPRRVDGREAEGEAVVLSSFVVLFVVFVVTSQR